MKKFVLVIAYTLLATLGYSNDPSPSYTPNENIDEKNIFTEDEYEIALAKSKREKKLVFIDFHAKWCTPCKWMEKNTLTDTKVKKILDEKYVTVKIDIDDFDGFDLKEQYQVRTLPTLVFLNYKGEIIHRLNETVGTERFLSIIENQSANVTPTVFPSNTSPFTQAGTTTSQTKNHYANKAPTTINTTVNTTKKDIVKTKMVHKPTPAPAPKSTIKTYKSYATKHTRNKSKKKNKSVKDKLVRKHLTLQIGSYNSLSEARSSMSNIQELSNLEIEIRRDNNGGKVSFKVLLGSFNSSDAANRYKYKLLKKHGVGSIVI